jgi:hypothetical protein
MQLGREKEAEARVSKKDIYFLRCLAKDLANRVDLQDEGDIRKIIPEELGRLSFQERSVLFSNLKSLQLSMSDELDSYTSLRVHAALLEAVLPESFQEMNPKFLNNWRMCLCECRKRRTARKKFRR